MSEKQASAPFGPFERMLAMRYIRAKRKHGGVALISVISFVGITLAVAALIVIMSVMSGFRETLLNRLLGLSGHVFIDTRGAGPAMLDEIERRALATSGVRSAIRLIQAQALVSSANGTTGVIVRAIRPQDLASMEAVAQSLAPSGGVKAFGDPEEPTILLGSRLALSLNAFEGDVVTLLSPDGAETPFGTLPRQAEYRVGGTFTIGAAEYDQALVIMPLEQAQLFFSRGEGVDQLELRIADPADPLPVKKALRDKVGPDLVITDWRDQFQSLVTALVVERNMMRIVFLIVVGLTMFNIVTGLIMLVKNKTRNIAILRTIGATQGSILRVFIMSGATIGVMGALGGVVLGVLVCLNISTVQSVLEFITQTRIFDPEVYSLSRLPAKLDWGEVALVSISSFVMAFLATLPPAWWASRMDPVEALRYE